MKSLFLTRTSHEIRTPLNAIMGFSQLLTLSEDLNSDLHDSATEIFKASSYLLNLITDILELSRIQAGEMSLSVETFDLAPVLIEIGAVSRQLATAHEINFEIDHDSMRGIELTADRTHVKQVLMNLITNGIKYNTSGGRLSVAASWQRQGLVRVSVSDTGPGLTSDQIATIYNPFERLGLEQTEIDGTGIGL